MKKQILDYLNVSFGIEGSDALELFSSYIATVEENTNKFSSLLGSNNYVELTRAAHTIKGCALDSGHEEMTTMARELEMAAKANDKTQCELYIPKIKTLLEALKKEK